MTITISAEDSRSIKAIEICARAGEWLHIREAGTHRVIGYQIPSQSALGGYYVTTQTWCSCQDARRHPDQACKHQLSVRLYVELQTASAPKPKRSAKPAPRPAPASGGVVLDLIREEDGSMRWERHDHSNGSTTYLPRREGTPRVANAADYDRCHSEEAF